MDEIIIYGKAECTFCDKAKMAISEFDIPWKYVDIDAPLIMIGVEDVVTLIKNSKARLPYITKNGVLLGGFPQLCSYLNNYEISLNLKLDNF